MKQNFKLYFNFIFLVCIISIFSACTKYNVKCSSKDCLRQNTAQTHIFNTDNSNDILNVANEILQNKGYKIELFDTTLGFLLATKDKEIENYTIKINLLWWALFEDREPPY